MTATRSPGTARRPSRRWARLQVHVFRAVTAMVDTGSPALRFGRGHAVRRRLLERPLVSLVNTAAAARQESPIERTRDRLHPQPVVALVTRSLGTGGVEAIVATLARDLPAHGLDCLVICEQGGSTADALRALGVVVVVAGDAASAESALEAAGPVVAAQLHNAPDHLIAACATRRIPLVPVIHTTDINLSGDDWARQSDLLDRSAAAVAVSETVKAFVESHLPRRASVPVTVVPNGVRTRLPADPRLARARLGEAIGVEIGGTAVVACLARYDMQKNIPGLVQAFLEAAAESDDVRLVVAGPVGDWLEYAHADAIRRAHPNGDRVHLLGSSSSADILDAADAFVLDSFFEGWPVAASEAVMAGLPLVISEVGGAQELVGGAAERGRILDNPGGPAATITLAQIGAARQRAVQSNSVALTAAFLDIVRDIAAWRARRDQLAADATIWLAAETMVASHAALLESVGSIQEDAS